MDQLIKFYKQHDQILLPLVFLLSALFIIIQFIMPNFSELTVLREDMLAREQKLNVYQNSYELLNGLNEESLNTDVTQARQALPPDKDPAAIYLAVITSVTKAESQLKTFSMRLGEVYKKGYKGGEKQPLNVITGIKVDQMDAEQLNVFVETLSKEFPLSQVTKVTVANSSADIELWFYYLPYNLTQINTENITPLNTQQQNTLRSIIF